MLQLKGSVGSHPDALRFYSLTCLPSRCRHRKVKAAAAWAGTTPGHEAGRSEGFPLDVHHSAGGSTGGALEPEVEASPAGTDGEDVEGT